jgi:hypothetical protein
MKKRQIVEWTGHAFSPAVDTVVGVCENMLVNAFLLVAIYSRAFGRAQGTNGPDVWERSMTHLATTACPRSHLEKRSQQQH